MGCALPDAIGAKLALPQIQVLALVGDGGFMFTVNELATAVEESLSIPVIIWHNHSYAMIRDGMIKRGIPTIGVNPVAPDFVKLAEAYGGHGIRCEKPGDLDAAIKEMIDVRKPVIFDCRVANLANCFPMIPSGKAHNEMLLPDEATDEAVANAISAEGKALV